MSIMYHMKRLKQQTDLSRQLIFLGVGRRSDAEIWTSPKFFWSATYQRYHHSFRNVPDDISTNSSFGTHHDQIEASRGKFDIFVSAWEGPKNFEPVNVRTMCEYSKTRSGAKLCRVLGGYEPDCFAVDP